MFLDSLSIGIMVAGTVISALFIIFLLAGQKYKEMTAPLDSKEFPLCELFGAGFAVLGLIRYKYTSKSERKRRQQIALIYGEKHSEYYLRVNAAQRVTYAFLLTAVGFAIYGLVSDIAITLVFLMFAFTAYYYVSTLPKTTLEKKTAAILSDFSEVVSKIALLVNAGMILKDAWTKVAYTGDSELYTEMQNSVISMQNGVSEIDAYSEFGTKCTSPEIKKFTSTIIQGLVKGNAELVEMIKQQSREIWDAKRHRVKQQGELAASKLLIPITIMFLGILVMIIIPIFTNLGV